jgi:hypothetical protein
MDTVSFENALAEKLTGKGKKTLYPVKVYLSCLFKCKIQVDHWP